MKRGIRKRNTLSAIATERLDAEACRNALDWYITHFKGYILRLAPGTILLKMRQRYLTKGGISHEQHLTISLENG